MAKQFIAKLLSSVVLLMLTTFVSMFAIRVLGLWTGGASLRLVSAMIFGFVVHYVLLYYFVPKFSRVWQGVVFREFIINICWSLAFVFLALAGLTCLLMIRSGSFDGGKIFSVTFVYIVIAGYFVASAMGAIKSCAKESGGVVEQG